jgi:hypothetical protein
MTSDQRSSIPRPARVGLVWILAALAMACTAGGGAGTSPATVAASTTPGDTGSSTVGPTASVSPASAPESAVPSLRTPSSPPPSSCDPGVTMRVDQVLQAGPLCHGAGDIHVLGWLAPSWGIGGTGTGIVPAWLGEPLTDPVLWLKPRNPDGCVETDDCVWLFVHVRPRSGVTFEEPERWVEVTGHFDDPLARTCAWSGINDPVTPERAVATCHDAFVAVAVQDSAAP